MIATRPVHAIPCPGRLAHLELHTADEARASAFYAALLGWQGERLAAGPGSYLALDLGGVGGGIVPCGVPRARWLPYAEVDDIGRVTATARRLGATVLLEPREGPMGWRSVVAVPAGAEIALWETKP